MRRWERIPAAYAHYGDGYDHHAPGIREMLHALQEGLP